MGLGDFSVVRRVSLKTTLCQLHLLHRQNYTHEKKEVAKLYGERKKKVMDEVYVRVVARCHYRSSVARSLPSTSLAKVTHKGSTGKC